MSHARRANPSPRPSRQTDGVTVQFTESPVSDGAVWLYHPTLRHLVPLTSDAL